MDIQSKESKLKEEAGDKGVNFSTNDDYLKDCPLIDQEVPDCTSLNYPCITCDRSVDCLYGGLYNYTCFVKPKIVCNVSNLYVSVILTV